MLVTIDAGMDLSPLARVGRRLKGAGNSINLSADTFLADAAGQYIGRICRYRECHTRVLCRAQHCGLRQHLNDDLHVVTLSPMLIADAAHRPVAAYCPARSSAGRHRGAAGGGAGEGRNAQRWR